MESVSSHIKLVPSNLRPEETVIHIKEVLQHLLQVSSKVCSEVEKRVDDTHKRLDNVTKRVKSAQNTIDQLAGNSKALKVFSSASYPVENKEPLGYNSLRVSNDDFSGKQTALPVISQSYPSVDEKKLQEKLNFYHIGTREKQNGTHAVSRRGSKYRSLSEALFYVSDLVSSQKDARDHYDIITSFDWRSPDSDTTASLLDEAPPSIVRRGQMRQIKVDDLHYHPQVPEHPEIELPPALPDLPGIAEDFDTENLGPTFAPVPSLPDLSSLLVEEQPITIEVNEHVEKSPILPRRPIVPERTAPLAPQPPPPPPPPLPVLALPMEECKVQVEAAKVEWATPGPSGPALDMHSSLMEAIRKAGGSGKAKLKAVSKEHSKVDEARNQESPGVKPKPGTGDLMADLMAKLSTRRKGISGPRPQETPTIPPGGMFEKVSSLISPPPVAPGSDDEGSEDVWND